MARTPGKRRQELVRHFQEQRQSIQQQWVQQMQTQGLLVCLTSKVMTEQVNVVYEHYVNCLNTGTEAAFLACARALSGFGSRSRLSLATLLGVLFALDEACRRAVCQRYQNDALALQKALALYTPVLHRVATMVTVAATDEREQRIKQEMSHLRMLVRAGMILSSQLSLKAVLQRIVNMACKVVQARYGALGVLDGKGGLSQFITAGIGEKAKRAIGPLPVGKGILGVLVQTATPLRLRDLTVAPQAHGFPPHHPPMRSFLGVPIISKGQAFGNLYLTEKEGADEFSEADQRLAMTLATQAAIAIENARLYEELQHSYQKLKRSQELLLRQEKLASLGRLASGVAHELNNPLNNVSGFIEVLLRRAQATALQTCAEFTDFPAFLTMAQREVDRAAAIVRRLLDFARQREPTFERVDLGQLITETLAFVERQAAVSNHRIVVASPAQPLLIEADAQMFQQLVLNLLTNALDALEDNGEVRIAMQARERRHAPAGIATWVEITVTDNGCGIPPEHMSTIFDPFFTTKEVGKGTGLGLPICQSIVEQHSGSIEVTSAGPGKGTTVIVRLPQGGHTG